MKRYSFVRGIGALLLIAALTLTPLPVRGALSLRMGDVNGDGSVNIADVALICRYIMGEAQLSADARELCDMNGDGSINVTDAVLVCMKVAVN